MIGRRKNRFALMFVSLMFASLTFMFANGLQARSYTVLPGDTLSDIALRNLPSPEASLQQTIINIHTLNPEAFAGGDINRLKPGQVLTLPDDLGVQVATNSVVLQAPQESQTQAENTESPAEIHARIIAKLRLSRPDFNYNTPVESQIPGLYEVQVVNGPILYVSADAKFLVAGDLYSVQPGEFVNLQEKAREKDRAAIMAAVDKKQQIVFSPKGETKAFVHVFTDVDCTYCQKLHQEIAEINDLGIEVRYLAYPRAGINSESSQKLATAWCADDPQATLTKLKNRERVQTAVCDDNPIAAQYRLGGLVGVNGTPNMVTEDGKMIGGYVPAEQLAEILGVK